ncbi:integrase core domain-containing protein [Corynebacterium faecale]|uniref:integrase core domain-containing protein n=1 Tax=Corynebacterium faecale TaxID=1758466 RepID=UPI00338EFF02
MKCSRRSLSISGTWPSLTDVLVESSKWIGWYNSRRLHSSLDYRPPREAHQD